MTVIVVGLAETGSAVVERLRAEGADVTVVEDRPTGSDYAERAARARALGAVLVEAPDEASTARLVRAADLVVPSPGVPQRHVALAAALDAGVPVRSEIDLAAERTSTPIVAVTGTNGKTTVTSLVTAMLRASGREAAAVGNIGRTLIGALADGAEVLVAEVSSFQLAFTRVFRPRVAVLLAVAEDHIDWHGDAGSYAEAKARIFANQRETDLLVFAADDPVARALAERAPARTVGVSLDPRAAACYRPDGRGALVAADGTVLAHESDLARALPHDVENALAAAAASLGIGATVDGVGRALRDFAGLPHRVTLVGDAGGVRYYDDSKATNPHAALHAVRSFESVVLLAGGRNKGLDLSVLADAADHIRAVVAFGEAAPEVAAAFERCRPVVVAATMREAVAAAAAAARPGDVVLLSPGCASFDAYTSYTERGDDFAAEVRAFAGTVSG